MIFFYRSHSHILSREPQKQVPLFDPVSGSRKRKATPEVKAELETIKPVSSVSPARKSVKRKAADGASRPTPAKRRAMGAACRAGLLEQNVKGGLTVPDIPGVSCIECYCWGVMYRILLLECNVYNVAAGV